MARFNFPTVIKTLPGFPGATGVAIHEETDRIYVSFEVGGFNASLAGAPGAVAVLDRETDKTIATIPVGPNPGFPSLTGDGSTSPVWP